MSVLLIASLGLLLAAQTSRAQFFFNDNFDGALDLGNALTGVQADSNVGASRQDAIGEPKILVNHGGESVWYAWTAPADVLISFDTLQSDFNTLLAVYTTNTITSPFDPFANLTNLTKIIENDDFGGYSQSLVTFAAVSNVTYFITVDGFYQPPTADGNILLHWGPAAGPGSLSAGDFKFTTSFYLMSQNESVPAHGANMGSTGGGRLTVTRDGGSRGQVLVDYTLTNSVYTNVLFSWLYGTNVYSTNFADSNFVSGATYSNVLPVLMQGTYSNVFVTNQYVEYYIQDNIYGQWTFVPQAPHEFTIPIPWALGGGLSITDTTVFPANPFNFLIMTNLGTNFVVPVCRNPPDSTGFVTNATATFATGTSSSVLPISLTFFVTNIYCVFTQATYFLPTAYTNSSVEDLSDINPFLFIQHPADYFNAVQGQLTFDDYQLSANVTVDMRVPVNQNNNHFIDHTFGSFPPQAPFPNRVLVASIDNVALATNESALLIPPTASTTLTNTLACILDQVELPAIEPSNDGRPLPYTRTAGTNVFNFERATLRCGEGIGTARVGVYRSTLFYNATTVNYLIDYNFGNRTPNSYHIFRQRSAGEKPGEGGVNTQGFIDDVQLQAGSDYATPTNATPNPNNLPADFFPVDGQLSWNVNDNGIKFIDIPITNDDIVEFNEDLLVQLYFPGTPPWPAPTDRALGYLDTCVLTIMFDDQPAGALDRNHNPNNDSGTVPPYNLLPGANHTVWSVAVQPDGKTVIGGDFSDYNTVPINSIARMNADGSKDSNFDPGDGADNTVTALTLDSNGRIIAGGAFSSINRVPRNGIARLNTDGSVDLSFSPGLGIDGGNQFYPTVWALAQRTNANILIAGEFSSYNSVPENRIAELFPDGSLNTNFDVGPGPDGTIWTMTNQPDGKVLIGGDFMTINGISRPHIARLNADGSLDTSFDPQAGADGTVYAISLQPDGKIIIAGAFHTYGSSSRNGVARLTSNGLVDLSFDPGTGVDDTVYSLALQPDGGILMGGIFTRVNQTRRVGIARLYANGLVDTTFMDTAYNQFAGVPTHIFNTDVEAHHQILALGLQPDGNVIIGGEFDRVGGGFVRDDIRPRNNVARLIGGATPGPGNVGLNYPSYTVDQFATNLYVTMTRNNGSLGAVSVNVADAPLPAGPGAAILGADYNFNAGAYGNPTWTGTWPTTWQIQDAHTGLNLPAPPGPGPAVRVDVLNTGTNGGDTHLNLQVSNPNGDDKLYLGGENISLGVALGQTTAPMTIVNAHNLPGTLGFSSSIYRSSEATNVVITVIRTNGTAGGVTVPVQTFDGVPPNAATNGINYRSNFVRLSFASGVTNQTFTVTNINDSIINKDHSFRVHLGAPTGGASNFLSDATVTLIDDDFVGGYAQFDSASYVTNENAGYALVNVTRNGGNAGTLSVQFSATNGTAVNGVNYIGVTTNLTWNNGDVTPRIIPIKLLDDGVVNPANLYITNRLFNPTYNSSPNGNGLGTISNAVVVLTNSDFVGTLAFSTTRYIANENGGPAIVSVVRSGGSAGSATATFAAVPGTATTADFTPVIASFTLGPGQTSTNFLVPIIDNQTPDTARTISLALSNGSPAGVLGSPLAATIDILDDESFNVPPGNIDTTVDPSLGFNNDVLTIALQADGRLLVGGSFTNANGLGRNRIARLNGDLSLDSHFSSVSPTAGANNSIFTILAQTDQRIVIGGVFTNYNSVNRNYLARLNYDGSIDTTFNPGSGPNGVVNTVVETSVGPDRKLLVGGGFTAYGITPRFYLARINNNGSLDGLFDTGLGANAPVFAIAVQADGKTIVGGDFTSFGGVSRNHLVRLNVDGSVDPTFNVGSGASDSIRALAVQLDGHILIGGLFTNYNGTGINHIARLNQDGSLDNTFNVAPGANDVVTSIAIQPDTRIMLGGFFTTANGVTRHRLTRINNDGTVDPTINFGVGCDGFVSSVVIATNGIVFGGGFTSYDGQPHSRLARIYGGSMSGSGQFEFDSANYTVDEVSTNVTINVRRRGGTSGFPTGNVFVTMTATNGSAVAGVNYFPLVTNLSFPPGEVLRSVSITVTQDFSITPDLTVDLTLLNPQPPGGPALGNQPVAELTIFNDDGAISLSSSTYLRNEDAPDGVATIPIIRTGSSRLPASVQFFTTTNGTAVAGTNYLPVSNLVTFVSGQVSNIVQVPVIHDSRAQGNTTVALTLTNAVGDFLFAPSTGLLTIVDVERLPGEFLFGQTNYIVNEGAGALVVNVLRTNGHSGSVSVNFKTVPGTATPGVKYFSTNGVLTFGDGESSKAFTVPLVDNNIADGNQSFSLTLSNATGGAIIDAPTNVPVTIIDNETGFTFALPAYVGSETNGLVSLTVLRQGDTNSALTVHYSTANGIILQTNIVAGITNVSTNSGAIAGVNYVGVTNGTLNFASGEIIKGFPIQLLHDPRVTGDLPFNVYLQNPQAPAQLVQPTNAAVVVQDAESGFFFTNTVFGAFKSATNVLITVVRSNVNTGVLTVNFGSTNGTATAGIDYTPVSGGLTFSNGIAYQTFSVPLINNQIVAGDRSFTVFLTNASPTNIASVVPPSTATVFITNDVAGLSFSSPFYSINENGIALNVNVIRSGYTNNTVSVLYSTSDGTAHAGQNYLPVSGSLTFTNGETVKTFAVPVKDDGIVTPDNTFNLNLANVAGPGVLVSPSSAIVNLHEVDGSLILPAGSSLTSESGPANGLIDSNETVTVLLALRNASGTNTINLQATLLATNGVTNPSGSQNYGALITHGPSVFRPFSFKAIGTNGQVISATLVVQDGLSLSNQVVFTFPIGNVPTSFSNNSTIVINDFTNATPYPSVITIGGLGGVVTKANVTLSNLFHTFPSDVDVLLVSPAGQKSYLMAKCGGGNSAAGVTLTFDDSASTSLTTNALVTSTNRPTSRAAAPPPFPIPAPPPPYATNLTSFNGGIPNGDWLLYVFDDSHLNSGMISNGWTLRLNTGAAASADVGLAMSASPTSVIAGSNVTFTVSITNYGPATASNLVVSDVLPTGAVFVSSIPAATTNTAGTVVWTLNNSMPTNSTTNLTLVVQLPTPGPATNTVTFTAGTADPNPDDDSATLVLDVSAPTADLVFSLTATPNPVFLGNNVNITNSLIISNAGPAIATGVSLTNTLPPSVTLVSVVPTNSSRAGNILTWTNLGNLVSGQSTSLTVVFHATAPGTLTNSAQAASQVTDPTKANNVATSKIVVEALGVSRSNGNVVITWPSDVGTFVLESTVALNPPNWTTVPGTAGQNSYTITNRTGSVFYRLRQTGP